MGRVFYLLHIAIISKTMYKYLGNVSENIYLHCRCLCEKGIIYFLCWLIKIKYDVLTSKIIINNDNVSFRFK